MEQLQETDTLMERYRRCAKDALDVQSACNLSGVVHSYSKAMSTLWEVAHAQKKGGTDWVNRHPIAVLFAVQVASITRVAIIADDACDYSKCYTACEQIARGENVEIT